MLSIAGVVAVGGVIVPLLVGGDEPVAAPTSGGSEETPSAVRAVSADESGPLALLRRSATASRTVEYSGTQYVSSWSDHGSASAVVDVSHRPGNRMTVRVHGGGADSTKLAPSPAPSPAGSAPVDDAVASGARTQTLALLVRNYSLRDAGNARSAGRSATIIEARPRGSSAVAGKFWIDRSSGVLLRRELYDSAGRTVRAAAFVDASIDASIDGSTPPSVSASPPPTPAPESVQDQAEALRGRGWTAPGTLPGSLSLFDVAMMKPADGRGTTMHLSYSDGLFSLSVFVQQGRLKTSSVRGWQKISLAGTTAYTDPGLTSRTVWADPSTVYTALGDAPDRRLEQAVSGFPRSTGSHGLTARIDRGLDRMKSWVS